MDNGQDYHFGQSAAAGLFSGSLYKCDNLVLDLPPVGDHMYTALFNCPIEKSPIISPAFYHDGSLGKNAFSNMFPSTIKEVTFFCYAYIYGDGQNRPTYNFLPSNTSGTLITTRDTYNNWECKEFDIPSGWTVIFVKEYN